jgi:hypothetical protein
MLLLIMIYWINWLHLKKTTKNKTKQHSTVIDTKIYLIYAIVYFRHCMYERKLDNLDNLNIIPTIYDVRPFLYWQLDIHHVYVHL